MQFLSLYVPAKLTSEPPSAEHMQAMGALMEDWMRKGVLKAAGGVLNRSTGMKATLASGRLSIEHGSIEGSSLMAAAGWAWLEVRDREQLAESIGQFLELAGDGTCEMIELMEGPPPEM